MHLPMPEKLRDLSLRHKILFANFLMVAVPVLLIAVLGTLVFAGLRFTGTLRQTELALLWPERGAAMSVSYAVSDLRWQSEHHGRIGAQRFEESCHLLEQKGIQVVILAGKDRSLGKGRPLGPQGSPEMAPPPAAAEEAQRPAPPEEAGNPQPQASDREPQAREVVYASPGAEAETIARQAVRSLGGPAVSGMRWQRNEFAFVHHARSGYAVYAYGHLPLPAPGQHDAEAENMRSAVEGIAFGLFLLALCFILWLGLFLARLISRQVLDPLARLRQAAEEVGRGRLDGRIEVRAHDEVGETCMCFDRMRQDLAAARAEQQRYEQGRRELIAGISHDLSTPLTAIGGYASGLADGIADTPEKRRHYADRITALVAQLSRLVDRLFLFSRLDLGRVTFHLKTVALDGCLRAWLAEARATQEPGEEIFLRGGAGGGRALRAAGPGGIFPRARKSLAEQPQVRGRCGGKALSRALAHARRKGRGAHPLARPWAGRSAGGAAASFRELLSRGQVARGKAGARPRHGHREPHRHGHGRPDLGGTAAGRRPGRRHGVSDGAQRGKGEWE